MADNKKAKETTIEDSEKVVSEAAEQQSEAQVAPDELQTLREELEACKNELAALNDKYLRMMAEYDNFRKRSAKEKESVYADAQADAVENILPIGDNLARAAGFTDPASVAKGIAMMQKSFEEALGKMGITEIEAEGKEFDPTWHNAVMHIEDEAYGENMIAEVLQKGYRKGDHVIRYAMVKVAN